MSGELVPASRPVERVGFLPAAPGVLVALADPHGQRISEWVPLVRDVVGLFAEWRPGTNGLAYAFVAWNPTTGQVAAGLLDVAITVRPENLPVELRIEPFVDTPSMPLPVEFDGYTRREIEG